MRKILVIFGVFLFLFSINTSKVKAQSPIRCGLLDETCCDLVSGGASSCQTGLYCDQKTNTCLAVEGEENPPERGNVNADPGQKLFCNVNGDPTTDSSTGKLYTAIGCIPVNDTNSFIAFILRWAIGIGGGIAFLLILVAGFQIMTSSGNPDRLKAGQELLTSAIAGLIMLIFSVFILSVIGVDILKIPGLTGETIMNNVPGPR